jgi:hypothetical protein
VKNNAGLSHVELLSLDLLIAVAQQRGRSFDEAVRNTEEQAQAQADAAQARWEARHGGLSIVERDKEVVAQIRRLAATLESAPTLGQLIEMRAEALRQEG